MPKILIVEDEPNMIAGPRVTFEYEGYGVITAPDGVAGLERYAFGDVEVNLRSCQVSRQGKQLEVSSKEFDLLKYFLVHSGEAISRDRLLEEVWGYDRFPTTRTVDAHIVRLRQKLEPKP